jgi:hypothetical protein
MMLPKVVRARCPSGSRATRLYNIFPSSLNGLGQANEDKLMSEGAAALVMKSEKSMENNSLFLI